MNIFKHIDEFLAKAKAGRLEYDEEKNKYISDFLQDENNFEDIKKEFVKLGDIFSKPDNIYCGCDRCKERLERDIFDRLDLKGQGLFILYKIFMKRGNE